MKASRGYTLVELIVAVGLFALVMLMATGAYLLMIGINRQAQATATAADNLAFVLESMTRNIRTGTTYGCNGGGDCASGGSSFSFFDASGHVVAYSCTNNCQGASNSILETINGAPFTLTDPSVNITHLTFYVQGTTSGDALQPHVTIVLIGTISAGANKTLPFDIETGATMRGVDI